MKRAILTATILFLLLACSKEDDEETILYFPPAGSGEWETVTPASLGWNTDEIPELLSLLEQNDTRAFILLKDGKIVIEEYFGSKLGSSVPFDEKSNWYWASAGKTLTAFTVGKAQEDGFLDINDRSSEYLGKGWTSLEASKEDMITVRHQLTMTSGLDDGVPDNHSFLPEDLKYKADAGTRWAYHNGPYTLLERVVEEASGIGFDDYFNSVLRDRTGMDGFWIWIESDHVYFSTARSMARFGLLMLNRGAWDGEKLLTDMSYYDSMVTTSQDINKSYGYLWWLNGKESFMIPETQIVFKGSAFPYAPPDMFSGIGKDGQYVSIVPSMNIVMIRMGEDPSSVLVPFQFLNVIWKQLDLIIR